MVERRNKRKNGGMETTDGTLFASGLIAGDALVGVMLALVVYSGQTLGLLPNLAFGPTLTWVVFAALAILLARTDWRRKTP
jgi:hypothetical protein